MALFTFTIEIESETREGAEMTMDLIGETICDLSNAGEIEGTSVMDDLREVTEP